MIKLTNFEVTVLNLLDEGYSQRQMPKYLRQNDIKPNSLSSVEVAITSIKKKYKVKTLFHLGIEIGRQREQLKMKASKTKSNLQIELI